MSKRTGRTIRICFVEVSQDLVLLDIRKSIFNVLLPEEEDLLLLEEEDLLQETLIMNFLMSSKTKFGETSTEKIRMVRPVLLDTPNLSKTVFFNAAGWKRHVFVDAATFHKRPHNLPF